VWESRTDIEQSRGRGGGLGADGDDGELQRAGGAGTRQARAAGQDWTGRGQCSRHETCKGGLGRARVTEMKS
jgi:hypothetical protein